MKTILITFGGTDPNDLTFKALCAIEKLYLKNVKINIILGLGYKPREKLHEYISKLCEKGYQISVRENIRLMAKEICEADIVITSNGRTIYEIASIGTPCISISQNERESRHLFVHISHGALYLGIAYTVSVDDISSAIKRLINDYSLRKDMNKNFLSFDFKENIDRVLNLILNAYKEWKRHENN